MSNNQLIFIQLNEVNFDVVKEYIEKYDDLPAFKKLIIDFKSFETYGEDNYNEIEPWIQWVSAHTGKSFAEHEVFRLGDIVKKPENLIQIFEVLEQQGLRVGVVSSMNARNRLKRAAYFIPDPWTDTPSDGSGFSRRLTKMLQQTVNDNASGKISISSLTTLAETVIRSFSFSGIGNLLKMIACARRQSWMKALILDQIIHMVHKKLLSSKIPDVSFVFLNAGAHIQHHYLFNSEVKLGSLSNPSWYVRPGSDPVRDMLRVYDNIIKDYIKLSASGARIILATGLTQIPYNRVKYYYRLKGHDKFLAEAGIVFDRVLPRMTRDFEIIFSNNIDKENAITILGKMRMVRDGVVVFGEIENQDCSIFVTLTYPSEILYDDSIAFEDIVMSEFGARVAFVAIKNGMHSTRGFGFVSPNYHGALPEKPIFVGELFNLTKNLSSSIS